MQHIFLSPHLDDAVLSCGGHIYQLAQAGAAVTVFTIMAGALPPDLIPHPFIEEHILRWMLGPDPVPGRQAEDRRAVAALGATVRFGPFADALFRTDGSGTALYTDLARLFGPVHGDDPVQAHSNVITDALDPTATIYAPLGAGGHVDHRWVRDVVLRWRQSQPGVAVFFYEEYPYSADSVAVLDAARAAIGQPLAPVVYAVDDTALLAKIDAIACYVSQISTFWENTAAMARAVRAYAAQIGQATEYGRYAERFWCVV